MDTVSDEDPEIIKEAVEKALSKATSDGSVGNLEIDAGSVAVMEPHVEDTGNGK